jgi:colanic acid/amylovoran biosynthesis glycosyltransferase
VSCPLAVFVPELGARSETFIRRHVQDLLPGQTLTIGGPLGDGTARDWDADGPVVDLGAVSDLGTVGRWLREYGVQVLLGEYLDASLPWLSLARELGIRFFVHAHGYDVSQRLRGPLYRREYLRYREAAGVITMSEASRARLIDLGLPSGCTHAIPYGVDVAESVPERAARDGIRVLAVGRMVSKKGPILTLDAFRRASASRPELRLDYVGDGPLLPAAAQFVHALGLHETVTLHGGRPNHVVQELLQTADVFVQHSLTDPETGDEEGLPVAILEAMAWGLPVIATIHAGIPEAVDDGVTGFLVEQGDSQSMAARIEQLARDRDLRLAMGRAGWEQARARFSWARERSDLLRVLGLEALHAP